MNVERSFDATLARDSNNNNNNNNNYYYNYDKNNDHGHTHSCGQDARTDEDRFRSKRRVGSAVEEKAASIVVAIDRSGPAADDPRDRGSLPSNIAE